MTARVSGGLAELGHALVSDFDPPSYDDVEAAGLSGSGMDGSGPYSWPELARAAAGRTTIVFVAEASAAHHEWLGIGLSDEEAPDTLMRAW